MVAWFDGTILAIVLIRLSVFVRPVRSKNVREHFYSVSGIEYQLHSMPLNDETAFLRLKARTNQTPEGALFIDEYVYDNLKQKFEPLCKDEAQITAV